MERHLVSPRSRAARIGAVLAFCLGVAAMTLESSDFISSSSGASFLIRRSLATEEVDQSQSNNKNEKKDRRPVLYALMNAEGLASQKVTLSCHLHLAEATGRDLILLPFRSQHYREGRSRSHALIRMEDYFDNTTKPYLPNVRWRTADLYDDDTLDVSILADAKTNCIAGSQAAMGTHFSVIVNEDKKLGNRYPEFLSQPIVIDWASRALAKRMDAKYAPTEDACIVGRPRHGVCSANSNPALLESSELVKKLIGKGMLNVFAKRGFSYSYGNNGDNTIISYDAIHLRRGDKCRGQWTGPRRCGPADDLPFIEMCKSSAKPFYVSTDEQDAIFLEALRGAGCVLFADLNLDLEKEIAAYYSKLDNPRWQSLHPKALSFAMESHIVKTAQESYTLGCSSFYYETMKYRQFKALSPVKLFRAMLGEFVNVDPSAPPRTDECLEVSKK